MLFSDKSCLREKLSNPSSISLHNKDEESDTDCDLSESYTVTNIVSNETMTSNYEYSCIPSKSSFLFSQKMVKNDNSEYFYDVFNKKFPDDNLIRQPIIYAINNMRETPYLLYLLELNEIDNEYNFMNLIKKNTNLNETTRFLSRLMNLNIEYSGFITHNNTNYLFFNCLDKVKEVDGYTWSCITEIVNYEKIYNTRINNSVKTFLLNNQYLLNIYSLDKSSIYELPYVYYFLVDKLTNNIAHCSNYENVIKITKVIENSKKNNYFISRRMLFTGIIKCTNKIDSIFDYYGNSGQYNSVYNLIMTDVNDVCLLIEINNKMPYLELSRLDV